MYSALEIAQYIIKRCNELSQSVSNLKLQKILYFIQAEFLVSKSEPCFEEEIEAWDFGPVVPVVYQEYKIYGSTSIFCFNEGCVSPLNVNDKEIVDSIIRECAQYNAAFLMQITLNQEPWRKAYRPFSKAVISKRSIQEYFCEEKTGKI